MTIHGIENPGSPIPSTERGDSSSTNTAMDVTGQLDRSDALLPAPAIIAFGAGDIGAEIALLGVRAGRDEEVIETKTEETEDQLQQCAERNEVREMHRDAGDIMSNAVAAGCMQICQGMTQMAGAGASSTEQGAFTGGASLFGAGATLFTAQGQASQQLDQALVTSYKAVADHAGQSVTEAGQGRQDARAIISNAIQFYQEYQQTKAQLDLVAAGQKA